MKEYPLPAKVALESTVITHGLPKPRNLELAKEMEQCVRSEGAEPATIGVINGNVKIGLSAEDLNFLADLKNPIKISRRDLSAAITKRESGGTTVAGTLFIAHKNNIQVFATGGIGGVHDLGTMDISADLFALSDTPLVVVCAGAKAILDLPKTIELLETLSVPVIGYGTNEFPAFYSRESSLPVSARLDTPEEVAEFASNHWTLGLRSSVLVCQPLPVEDEIPAEEIIKAIKQAHDEAERDRIHGQALTPYLLSKLAYITEGRSVTTNVKLLLNNARLASRIALAMSRSNQAAVR